MQRHWSILFSYTVCIEPGLPLLGEEEKLRLCQLLLATKKLGVMEAGPDGSKGQELTDVRRILDGSVEDALPY